MKWQLTVHFCKRHPSVAGRQVPSRQSSCAADGVEHTQARAPRRLNGHWQNTKILLYILLIKNWIKTLTNLCFRYEKCYKVLARNKWSAFWVCVWNKFEKSITKRLSVDFVVVKLSFLLVLQQVRGPLGVVCRCAGNWFADRCLFCVVRCLSVWESSTVAGWQRVTGPFARRRQGCCVLLLIELPHFVAWWVLSTHLYIRLCNYCRLHTANATVECSYIECNLRRKFS